jgi:hypothetical protein
MTMAKLLPTMIVMTKKVTPSIISFLTEVQADPIASWVIRSFASVGLHDEEKR